MAKQILITTANDAMRNFTRYAAMVDAGAEVIITRRGRATLKLMRAAPTLKTKNRQALVRRALAIRSVKSFNGKFVRREAYSD